jgi:hypothetical protein
LNDLNQRLYQLAEKRREKEKKAPGYHLPDAYEDDEGRLLKDKKMAILTKRYEEEEKNTVTEQE